MRPHDGFSMHYLTLNHAIVSDGLGRRSFEPIFDCSQIKAGLSHIYKYPSALFPAKAQYMAYTQLSFDRVLLQNIIEELFD